MIVNSFQSFQSPTILSTPSQPPLLPTPFAAAQSQPTEISVRSILFVDRAVGGYERLLKTQPGLEIKILDSSQDAIEQITQTLALRSGIESIQILSHGVSGGLALGDDFLNSAALDRQSQQIQTWKQALTQDADILLYGCNVSSGTLGQSFIQNLSQLTGADVAASDNLTGQGGDWTLESSTGTIEATIALNAIGMATYQSSLNAPVWARSTGGSRDFDNDTGNAIAVDGAGNTYITGKLQGSNINFGGTTVSTKDLSPDAFVSKLDASGNVLWTKTFGGSSAIIPSSALDAGQGITVDSEGNVFVIGSFQGTMNLGSSSLNSTGILDVFVLKLNGANGNVAWAKNFGGAGIEQGFAIGLDGSNNAYITGTFGDATRSATANFGNVTLQKRGNTDAFIAKLNGGTGDVAWAKSYGSNANDTGFGIAATSGGVYVTGNTQEGDNFDIFAIKLDSGNGNTLWDKKFGGSGEDSTKAIAVDGSGNAYLTGFLKSSTATFGGVTVQSSGADAFAVKLNNADGSVAWAKSLGSSGEEYGNGIGLDGNGNVYIAGSFTSSTWNLGSATLTKNDTGSADVFTLKLNSTDGGLTWAKSFGGSNFESAYGIAVDGSGNSYLTGEFFSSSLSFGNKTVSKVGGFDLFVTKLDNVDPIVVIPTDREATGSLTVTGTASEGSSLTASLTNVSDPDGATTTAYRWQEFINNSWVNLSGQTNAVLAIASDQSMVGKQVRVIATTTDTQGGTTEFTGTAQTIANIDDPATGSLAVTGTAIVGGSLSASLTSVVDPDGTPTIGYRWQELSNGNWIDISGQTSATFNIVNDASNVGKQIRVIATTTDPLSGTTAFTSAAQTIAAIVVDPIDREATGNLVVTGTAEEGGSLTANLTNVVDADGTTTTAYRWQELVNNAWVNLAGQTAAILNIASDQSMVGKQVRVIATTTDPQGGTTEFTGTAQTIINVDDPATGTLSVVRVATLGGGGNTFIAILSNLVDPDGTPTIAYRWQELSNSNWIDITGQTSATFDIASDAANVGKQVRVIVTTTDPFDGKTSFTSAGTTNTGPIPVDPIDREATGNLAVTGTPAEGGSLTASLTDVSDADGATTTAYRWQELINNTWTNLSGQTTAILNVASDPSMVGKQVRVIATTTDTQGGTTEFIGTAQTIGANTIPLTPSPLDLVFYDPTKGQVSFGFVGAESNIVDAALAGDAPALTRNSTGATPEFGPVWQIISANVDVDKDAVKDMLFVNTTNNAVAILFGEARTGSDRQFAYRNSAFATLSNGQVLAPGLAWTIDFASNKIGANNEAGIFWRSTAGDTAIWSFTTATVNGVTSATIVNSGVIASVGANSGWRAIGDGEFNQDIPTREVFWVNDTNGSVATWSLGANRTTRTSKFAWTGQVPTSAWDVVGIGNVAGTGVNDNIVWQQKGLVAGTANTLMVNWTMLSGERTTPLTGSAEVLTLSAADRIKALADIDGDGVLDLVGQRDSDGSIAAYALTSSYALKNTAAPRTQYTASNTTYRPGKGGPNNANLELVNVAQYGV